MTIDTDKLIQEQLRLMLEKTDQVLIVQERHTLQFKALRSDIQALRSNIKGARSMTQSFTPNDNAYRCENCDGTDLAIHIIGQQVLGGTMETIRVEDGDDHYCHGCQEYVHIYYGAAPHMETKRQKPDA